MNQNYPEYVMEALRESENLQYNDTSMDEELSRLSPYSAFLALLESEGIYGYAHSILSWIEDTFKVRLETNYAHSQSTEDFVQGMANIAKAYGSSNEFILMKLNDNGKENIYFKETDPKHSITFEREII